MVFSLVDPYSAVPAVVVVDATSGVMKDCIQGAPTLLAAKRIAAIARCAATDIRGYVNFFMHVL